MNVQDVIVYICGGATRTIVGVHFQFIFLKFVKYIFFHFDQRASMKRFVWKKSSQETYKQMHLMFILNFFVFGKIQTGIETHGSCIESHCELATF